jgi:hypothetical protein
MQQPVNPDEQYSPTREEKYFKHWQGQREYYSKRSKTYKRNYYSLVLFSTIGAIIVPILIVTPDIPKIWPTILSGLVSISIAVENLFHYGDNWRSFRQTLESLRRERVLFDTCIGVYAEAQDPFILFVQRSDAIMNTETTLYFEINRQPSQNSKASQGATLPTN